jgi:hypothetical protein
VLVCKGKRVRFVMKGGRSVRARGSMLHDPSGRAWGRCSVLVASFTPGTRRATDAELRGEPRDYFGKSYSALVGRIALPPKALSEWKRVGEVERIYYWRTGTRAPGPFQHPFGKRRAEFLFVAGKLPVLYHRGGAYRLELGNMCAIDDRGLVYP